MLLSKLREFELKEIAVLCAHIYSYINTYLLVASWQSAAASSSPSSSRYKIFFPILECPEAPRQHDGPGRRRQGSSEFRGNARGRGPGRMGTTRLCSRLTWSSQQAVSRTHRTTGGWTAVDHRSTRPGQGGDTSEFGSLNRGAPIQRASRWGEMRRAPLAPHARPFGPTHGRRRGAPYFLVLFFLI